MDLRSAPARPPPPPPPQVPLNILEDEQDIAPLPVPEGRQDLAASDYVDSPEQVTSPPSFAEALMAASPTSPPDYTPYSPGSEPPSRSLAGAAAAQRYTDEPRYAEEAPRYADEPAYAADSGGEQGSPSLSAAASEQRHHHHQGEEPDEDEDEDEEIPDLPPVIIITGASSGLGLAFFQHFAAREPSRPEVAKYDVVGIDKSPWRLPGKGFQWKTTIGRSGKFVQLDLTAPERRLQNFARNYLYAATTPAAPSPSSYDRSPRENGSGGSPAEPRRRYPRPVSLIIHCAATRGLVPAAEDAFRGDPSASAALDVMDAETMRRAFDVNVVGGLQLVQAVLPHLQLHAERVRERQDEVAEAFGGSTEWLDQLRQQGSRASLQLSSRPLPPRDPPPRVVVMGSRMGSVGANATGGAYAYRASKAALNAVVRSLSIDVPDVCFASVYPGSLKTGMVSVKEESVITCEESLEDMLPLIDNLGDGKLISGCFVDRFGDPMKL